MTLSTVNIMLNRRLLAIFVLGFASGLPLALTGGTLMAWFTEADINLKMIGALTLLGLPYTFKFLWAGVMDYYHFFPKLGKRKSWILLMQAGVVIALLILANNNPEKNSYLMLILAFLVAFFSASQDISINAYTTELLLPDERGLGAAYTVFAYRIAMLVSGGLALIFADYWGFKVTYQIMALVMIVLMIATYYMPKANEIANQSSSLYKTIRVALLDILTRDKSILIILFIIFYKFGDALALSLMTNFLLKELAFSLTEIGVAYKVVSMVAVILGGIIGGVILTRMNLFFGLLIFGLMQSFSNLFFVLLAVVGKNYSLMILSVFIENFCSGLSTAALVAFIMYLCNQSYTATQFAFFSAFSSLGRVFLGPLAAFMVAQFGWQQFFVWSFLLCFPGIFLLMILKNEVLQQCIANN